MKIKEIFKADLEPWDWTDLKYPFGGRPKDLVLTERQLGALKNLIFIAAERLWLCKDYPKLPEFSTEYTEDMSEDGQRIAKESIKVCKEILGIHTKANLKKK